MKYLIYDKASTILRQVQCSEPMSQIQPKEDEFIIEGEANDATQKVKFDGFDADGQPINPRVVDKSLEEIEADDPNSTPAEIPHGQRLAMVTNEQWQNVSKRISDLEKKT